MIGVRQSVLSMLAGHLLYTKLTAIRKVCNMNTLLTENNKEK